MKIRITKNHVDALCVLIGVLGMGSLYFQVLRMPLMAAMLIASILLLTRAHHPKISVQNVRLTLLLTAALLLTSFVNPQNGIHINDLHKTVLKLDEAANALKQIAKSGRRVLFVATKKQAKEIVAEKIAAIGMPYVTERWAGGMLTNFPTIRKAVKKMSTIDKMTNDGTFDNFSKREKLQIARQRAKLEKNLGSIADLTRLPAALFVVDVQKESNAVKEAKRLNIPVFAMVDTCCDPTDIDYVIPANDDATKSIAVILDAVCGAISEGLEERKLEKEKEAQENEAHEGDAPAKKDAKPRIKKAVKASVDAEEAAVAEVVAATEQKAE